MRCEIGSRHPLRQLFAGVVEQAFFSDVGICDVKVTNYLTQLLTEFIHIDDVFRLRGVNGQTIREVSEMRMAAQVGPDVSDTVRQRLVNRYIGDFTLFWTGVYPEQLRPRVSGADRLDEYLREGKRSYGIAGEIDVPALEPPCELLRQLSTHFEHCVHGLHLVRESWDRMSVNHN